MRIVGARGARWRRRSVPPSGGFTSPGSMYFFPSMSWAAYGSDTATCRIERVAGELGHDGEHVTHGAAWCGPNGQPDVDGAELAAQVAVRYFRGGAVGQRQGRRAAVPAPNTFSQEWANDIADRIKRAEDHTLRIAMDRVARCWPRNATSCAPSSGPTSSAR